MEITFAFAFTAGLASFLSPCVLPLVPVYLASLYGPEIFETGARKNRMPIFLHSLSFVIGFSVVFAALGTAAGLAGFAIGGHVPLIRWVVGGLLIAFGLFMLAALRIPWLNFERRLANSKRMAGGYLRSFLTGAVFSVAWTPCVGPILGSILTLAWASETAVEGGYLLAIYSLGLGLPFLIIGAAFDLVMPLLKRIGRHSRLFYIIAGALLIIAGILVLTDTLVWF